jgi:hypothetical protein
MEKGSQLEAIKKELEKLPQPYTVLVLTQPSTHFQTYLSLIEYLTKREKMRGVCVTITRTAASLIKLLKERDIDTDGIYFIDCISKISGSAEECENCLYVSHPSNLTDISLAVTNGLNKLGDGKKFFIVDSWSSLLIYNDNKKVLGFSNFIINKLRAKETNGLMVTLQAKTDEEFANSLSVFCDKVITL